MPGPWYTADRLLQDVAETLKKPIEELKARWSNQCARACQTAYADIRGILMGKGYTIGQLDAWDDREIYSRQQALFWIYTESSLGEGYDDKEIDKLDRRKSLEDSATIMIGNQPVKPGDTSGAAVGVAGGVICEDGYRFNGSTEF